MSFTRTNSGISNNHLFHNVDIIIYTEGGDKSFSIEDIEEDKYNTSSIDIKFWSGLFNAAKLNRTVKFKALGSKSVSKTIRDKINGNEIKNVAIALDRDLDFVLSQPKESPLILYTKGYSWENDVYTEENTIEQIESFLLEQLLPENILHEITTSYDDFKKVSQRLLRLEIIFRTKGIRFITDMAGERFFNSKKSSKIDKKQITNIINQRKKLINERPAKLELDIKDLCPIKNNYGKLIAALSINIISYICKKHSKITTTPRQILECNMLERYISKQIESCDEYYKNIIDPIRNI
ncbi:hypothetical protein [Shewanella mangrovisoli]|uniref:hypothetical protein n=1 Tax=Shewanella mangrovisoli TaxID=2864211 RepID=UPI0035B81D29